VNLDRQEDAALAIVEQADQLVIQAEKVKMAVAEMMVHQETMDHQLNPRKLHRQPNNCADVNLDQPETMEASDLKDHQVALDSQDQPVKMVKEQRELPET